jgi:pyruvate dehydrogenase E1 component beta subunit
VREITYLQAVSEALREEMDRDQSVLMMGEDIGVYGGGFGVFDGFGEVYGARGQIIETPISEATFTGAGVAMAMMGFRPVIEIMFSDFMTLASDQLINHGAKYRFMTGGQVKVPLVVRTPAGSGTGAAAQHSQSLEALYLNTPGLKVVMPSTPYDVKGLLKAAIRDDNPVIFYEHKLLYETSGLVPETDEDYVVPMGRGDIKRQGSHVTLVAYSVMALRALSAAAILEKEGIDVEIVDPRTLYPLDDALIIQSVMKTGRLMIVHEAPKNNGFGAEVAARVAESPAYSCLKAPVVRLAGLNMPIPHTPSLEKKAAPQTEDIAEAVRDMMGKSRR